MKPTLLTIALLLSGATAMAIPEPAKTSAFEDPSIVEYSTLVAAKRPWNAGRDAWLKAALSDGVD